MDQSRAHSSNPETVVAIPQQFRSLIFSSSPGERIGDCQFPIHEPPDSASPGDQESTILVFSQTLDTVRLDQRIEFPRTGFPSPYAVLYPHPENAFAILIQAEHCPAKGAALAIATELAILKGAQLSI